MTIRYVANHCLKKLRGFFAVIRGELPRLILLNILFWGVALAVVTLSPSVTAMLSVLRGYVTGEKPETTLTGYWDNLTARTARTLFVGTGYLLLTLLSFSVTRFYYGGARGGQAWMFLPFAVALLLFVLLVWYGFYLLLLLATDLPLGDILKASLALTIAYPITNLAVSTLLGAVVLFCYFHPFFAIGWHLIIGFAFSGLVIAFACWPNIQRYLLHRDARQRQTPERTSDALNHADE